MKYQINFINFVSTVTLLLGTFQQYDHGPNENLRFYGSEVPPEYNLSNIRTKIHILYGTNDALIPSKVVKSCII